MLDSFPVGGGIDWPHLIKWLEANDFSAAGGGARESVSVDVAPGEKKEKENT